MIKRILCLILMMTPLAGAQAIRVGVAVSLRDAMMAIGPAFERQTNQHVEFIFGSSGQIMAQIVNGAPIDAFISAGSAQVDELEKANLVQPGSRRVVAGNSIVLIVPASGATGIASFDDLRTRGERIAIGEPTTVPAGQYAMQVLTKLNLATSLERRLVYGSNVRQVLSYVERGEVAAGIVYSTDAKEAGERVRVVATAPPDSHDPVIYPAAVIKLSSQQDTSRLFLDFLASKPAKEILAEKGFSTPSSPTTKPSE